MSGCHVVPAMSGFEDGAEGRINFCIGCREKLPCKCIWEAIRDLQEKYETLVENDKVLESEICRVEENVVEDQDFDDRIVSIEESIKVIFGVLKPKQEIDLAIEKMHNRIDELESFKHLRFAKFNLAPHKCPICVGEGKNKNKLVMDQVIDPTLMSMKNPDCHACEGKGVVWG